MRYEFWLGWRYLFTQRREKFISIIAVLSVLGVALGVAALIIVLAVMSGFDADLQAKIVGANAHITVEGVQGVHQPSALAQRIGRLPHVMGASPYVNGQVILRTLDRALGVIARGIDPSTEGRVSSLPSYVHEGAWALDGNSVLIGRELANQLGLALGDTLTLLGPGDGQPHHLRVTGVFSSGMYEYDASLVFIHLSLAQTMFALPGEATGIAVRVDSLDRVGQVAPAIKAALGPAFRVRTWQELNRPLFDALKLEKTVMFLILTLIVLVAAANIVSTLIMMVMEKTKDIGVLQALGASGRSIHRLFTWEGFLIGGLGTALGFLLGVGVCWALATYKFIHLPSSIYYIDTLPVRIEWRDTVAITLAALGISLVATVYPAWQASRLNPVEALRYE